MLTKARWTASLLLAMATACTPASGPIQLALAGQDGRFWDLIAEQGKMEPNITQGFCFLPNQRFYAYFYEQSQRVPYTWGLHDISPPQGIPANLKEMHLQDSVLTLQGTMKFNVKFFGPDTVRLEAVEHTNTLLLTRNRLCE